MANSQLPRAANAPGDFFVDSDCISHPYLRQVAPTVLSDGLSQSVGVRQSESNAEDLQALTPLVSCLAACIGTSGHQESTAAIDVLPQ